MDDPVSVRPATAADLPGVGEVAARTWRATYATLIPDADIERFLAGAYDQVNLERTRQRLRSGFLVATAGGEVIGYAMGGENREAAGELFALYVLPERQGQGIGRRLWQGVAHELRERGFTEIRLWVLAANHPARRFYGRQGARAVEERSVPIGDKKALEVGYRASLVDPAGGDA